jgi:hypothetical protein
MKNETYLANSRVRNPSTNFVACIGIAHIIVA